MDDEKKKKLINSFFKEQLSDKEKEEFLKRASSDKTFVNEFINQMKQEADIEKSDDEEETGDSE